MKIKDLRRFASTLFPYAFSSRVIVATVLALAVYGWRTALAGRPMFGAFFLKDKPAHRA